VAGAALVGPVLLNGSGITAGVRVPLRDGDRIHLGAWTSITICAG